MCLSFKNDSTNIHNGRRGKLNIQIGKILEEERNDQRLMANALAHEFPLSGRFSIHTSFSEKLRHQNLCARGLPKMLMDEQNELRKCSGRSFLESYRPNGDDFLSHIIMGYEMRMSYTIGESKQESSSPNFKKFMQSPY